MHGWRSFLLRCFGAQLEYPVFVYPTARVWAPWNLRMGKNSTIADNVDCYCVTMISIGEGTTVSQYSYLCAASHDYGDPGILKNPKMPLLCAPIDIGNRVWVTSDVFVGPGVKIADGTVILARSTVTEDIAAWKIAAGSPAKVKKDRVLRRSKEEN